MINATIHVVDDDTHARHALSRLLRSYEYNVRTYECATHFLHNAVLSGPGCLVLDLKIPEIDGLDLQATLSARAEYLPIIFISGQADIETCVRVMKAGAVDFLIKPLDDLRLLAAVRSALAYSEEVLTKRNALSRDQTAFVSLTRREQEVCLRIAQGLLNKQVGFELGTTEKTVKVQRAKVMQKLGAGSLPDIVRLVERLRAAGAIPSVAAHLQPSRYM